MWSEIYLEYSTHQNFNVGFSSYKNDVHIQLSQWQYWWWFWFVTVWSLYFLIIFRCYNNKIENYNLTINTSMRSHGKWGDFLVAIIPLSWCGNILINSNFILRMLEWQNESSLFTIRIQGKQWYWAYKYNSDISYNLSGIFINVGNNNWVHNNILSNNNLNNTNNLLSFLYDYEFKKIHNNLLKKISLTKNTFKKINNAFNDTLYKNLNYKKFNTKNIILKYKSINQINQKALLNKHNFNTNLSVYNILKNNNNQKYNCINKNINSLELITKLFYNKKLNIVQTSNIFIDIKNNLNYFDTDRLDDTVVTSDNYRVKNYKFPIKINKGILNKQNINTLQNNLSLIKNIFFNFKTYKLNISEKQSHVEQFWGFRQKRYKKLRSYSFLQNTKYNNDNYQQISNFVNNKFNKYYMYTVLKNNKYKNELIPVTLARRLLRTKRTLVLPVHINITLITNSYDVVHFLICTRFRFKDWLCTRQIYTPLSLYR